jgi:hypothetical protein
MISIYLSRPPLLPFYLSLRDLVSAYLPADQNHALMKVAGAVMELHSECIQKAKALKAAAAAGPLLPPPPPSSPPNMFRSPSAEIEEMTNMLNQSVLADPAGTIFSATEHVLTDKRNFDEDLHLSPEEETTENSPNPSERFFGENSAMRYSGIDVRNTKAATPRKISPVDRMNFPPPLSFISSQGLKVMRIRSFLKGC